LKKNAASDGKVHSADNDTDFDSLLLAVRIPLHDYDLVTPLAMRVLLMGYRMVKKSI